MKFSLNSITTQNMVKTLSDASLLSSYGKNFAKLRYEPEDWEFRKKIYRSLNLRFDLLFWCFAT